MQCFLSPPLTGLGKELSRAVTCELRSVQDGPSPRKCWECHFPYSSLITLALSPLVSLHPLSSPSFSLTSPTPHHPSHNSDIGLLLSML